MRVIVHTLLGCALALSGFVLADDSDCAVCHDEVALAFERTAHATAPGWDPATGCTACHGPGDAHMESGDAADIIRPELLSSRESSDSCLGCHQQLERHFDGARSNHRLNEVGCLSCHNPHLTVEHALTAKPLELCSSCHSAVASQFERPRSHPIDERGEACSSCHDVHGSRTLRASGPEAHQTCESCHFEKAGPFVYDHGTLLVDGCASCHEVHGSTNRHLLRHDTQVNLCYECHSAAATPGWHSAAQYANRKCTACHSAIHGSNTDQFFLED
jgi:DmsE family decaheme c-type cytochrome